MSGLVVGSKKRWSERSERSSSEIAAVNSSSEVENSCVPRSARFGGASMNVVGNTSVCPERTREPRGVGASVS